MSHFPFLYSLYVHCLLSFCLSHQPISLVLSRCVFPTTRSSPLFIFPAATCQRFICLGATIALQPGQAAPTGLHGHGLLSGLLSGLWVPPAGFGKGLLSWRLFRGLVEHRSHAQSAQCWQGKWGLAGFLGSDFGLMSAWLPVISIYSQRSELWG